jgi:glyoxylase-like metal-dependent hydrolase (beta-lactamase superfamily II)
VSGYIATDFDTGQSLQFIDDEHDLFGDGTVVSFPTAGHTPGHQSLRVHTEHGGEFVLCGDACYLQHSLDHLALPGVVADRDAALLTLHLFRRFRDEGATLMFGHDPDVWASVPQAPVRLG